MHSGAAFTVSRFKDGKRTDEYWSEGTLSSAMDTFCQQVRNGEVDRMEIRSNGNLIFHYPLDRCDA